jgi:hypothetical protein
MRTMDDIYFVWVNIDVYIVSYWSYYHFDFLAFPLKVFGWAQAMPKFASDLMNYVQTFLERTYERCRTSYMEVWTFPDSIFFCFIFYCCNSCVIRLRISRALILKSGRCVCICFSLYQHFLSIVFWNCLLQCTNVQFL